MSDANLVGAGQLVTCGTGFFSLAGKTGYSPRVIAALRARMRAMLLSHHASRSSRSRRLGLAAPSQS